MRLKMERTYTNGTSSSAKLFTGIEVENTPAYGKKTLFVVDRESSTEIFKFYTKEKCEHIFFGANHSFNPQTNDEWNQWEKMIMHFLREDILCSLDIPSTLNLNTFLEFPFVEYHNFIPQLRLVVPYINHWPYNTTVKIDDTGYNKTNPGVWCHSLHDLKHRNNFTPWSKYTLDKKLK